eukprot:jgi/Mesvir1/26321/Mv22501-RA.1
MSKLTVDHRSPRAMITGILHRLTSPDDVAAGAMVAVSLCLLEGLLCLAIVARVPYTEIDWEAYMSQVDGFLSGERDYTKLRGGTGPLVYPAGFLYIFSALKYITSGLIYPAQLIFCALYVLNAAVVLAIYVRSRLVPPWALPLLCASKRVHSIFVLRLFNDVVAMLLVYASFLLLLLSRHSRGGYLASLALYSGAVSVKMNTLLFAPGLLFVMLKDTSLRHTVASIGVAGAVQLVLGWPFLSTYPRQYLTKAFDLGRVFLHYWSVNLKFLPEHIFTSSMLATGLLVGHVGALLAFASYRWGRRRTSPNADARAKMTATRRAGPGAGSTSPSTGGPALGATWRGRGALSDGQIALVLFSCNFVGIVFARTLHYQFYSWYFHTLPLLLWCTGLPTPIRLLLWLGIELCWNIFPSTPGSSLLLLVCHAVLLARLWTHMPTAWARATSGTVQSDSGSAVAEVRGSKTD